MSDEKTEEVSTKVKVGTGLKKFSTLIGAAIYTIGCVLVGELSWGSGLVDIIKSLF